jgi:hypothetical protein
MNLALGAVFLAILLIPPLVLLYCYSKGNHARQMPKLTLVEYLLLSAILALFFHSVAIKLVVEGVFNQKPDYQFIFQFLTGKQQDLVTTPIDIEKYFFDFAIYILWLCMACGFMGFVGQLIATRRKLRMMPWLQEFRNDRKPSFFAYYNDWWYFFRANEYSRDYARTETPALVYTHVVVDTKDLSIFYSGFLHDFSLREGTLEFVYLTGVTKTILNKRRVTGEISIDEGDSKIISPSGILCVPYSKITNIYVSFIDPPAISEAELEAGTPIPENPAT